MERVANRQVEEAIQNFKFEGTLIDTRPYGSGHINEYLSADFLRLPLWEE